MPRVMLEDVKITVRDYIVLQGVVTFNETINLTSNTDINYMDNQLPTNNDNFETGVVPEGAPNAGSTYVPTTRCNVSIKDSRGRFVSYRNCEPVIRNAVTALPASH